MPLRRRILLPLATLLLLASCQKDEAVRWLEVTVEPYAGSKVAVDGVTATWVDGETIRINSTTAVIHRRSNNGDHAYIDATAAAAVNRALYPASLADGALSSDAVTIHLPATYRYRTDGSGHQLLEVPLAARATDDQPLEFKHLTGALSFTIVNNFDTPIDLDSLCVESDAYGLSGSRSLNFASIGSQAPVAAASAADRKVALLFEGETLAASASLTVVLPIAPVGADNHFTVRVSARHQGTRYTYSRSQATGGALVRNEIGYAQTPLSTETTTTGPIFEIKEIANDSCKFKIKSPSDFLLMAEAVTNQWQMPYIIGISGLGYYNRQSYILTTDLDMSGMAIGSIANFRGSFFNGGGHTISNLTINSVDEYCGLFQLIATDTKITELTLNNTTLNLSAAVGVYSYYVAPLVCDISNVTIQNCHIVNTTITIPGDQGNTYYGGMVAQTNGSASIQGCSVESVYSITQTSGQLTCGGLLACASGSSTVTISNCSVDIAPSSLSNNAKHYFGGIVGQIPAASVYLTDIVCDIDVALESTSAVRAGGLVGSIANSVGRAIINADYAVSGQITVTGSASSYLGAYVGYKSPSSTVPSDFPEHLTLTLNGSPVIITVGN